MLQRFMKYFKPKSINYNDRDEKSDFKFISDSKIYICKKSVLNYSYEEMSKNINIKIKEIFKRKLKIMKIDNGACNGCNYEISNINKCVSNLERIKIDFVNNEDESDIFMISGTASRNMDFAEYFNEKLFDKDKKIISIGTEACEGGIFRDAKEVSNSIDSILPVDVYVSDCPPNVKSIVYAIEKVLESCY